ncbi:LytTR family DNA-binding domain-containing protein [Proteiniphilum sp.]|uniref:LytR/AlgR family response regulator transcription factor n=1 Tax=Proteiniphilum sp. TaxID=1926877 RepID=UPI0033347D90
MRKINCAIIDDEPPASDILKYYIDKTPNFEVTEIYYDPIKALEGLRTKKVDVIFCDVEMPDINGLQLLDSLCLNQNKNALVVIISAHAKYAVEGFNINAIDYLLKPVPFARYLKTTQKILDYIKDKSAIDTDADSKEHIPSTESSKDYIFIKSKGKLLKLNYTEILYIEAIGDYVKICLENGKSIVIMDSLKHLEKTLPNDFFKRIHRSYIVAISQIKAIEYKKVMIGENISLPISNSYYNTLYDSLVSNHIVKTISDR